MSRYQKSATAGASDAFLRRVNREITADQYVKSLDARVSERRKAEQHAVKGATKSAGKTFAK
jgi:hypothetical protein